MNKKAKSISVDDGKIIVEAMKNPVWTHSIKAGETIVTIKDKKIGGNQTMNTELKEYLEKMENRINKNTIKLLAETENRINKNTIKLLAETENRINKNTIKLLAETENRIMENVSKMMIAMENRIMENVSKMMIAMENRLMTAINKNTEAINALSDRIDNLVVKNNLIE